MTNAPLWLSSALAETRNVPTWLRARQDQQRASFLARGLPLRQEERWRYNNLGWLTEPVVNAAAATTLTDSKPLVTTAIAQHRLSTPSILLVVLNGRFAPEYSDLALLPSTMIFSSLATAFLQYGVLLQDRFTHDSLQHPFASLNAALVSDGIFIMSPEHSKLPTPIHILHLHTARANFMACPRTVIIAGANSALTIVEDYIGLDDSQYFTNAVTEIDAQRNTQIDFYKMQRESSRAAHLGQLFVNAQHDAQLNLHALALGGHFGRDEVNVTLSAAGAVVALHGFYYARRDAQQIDNHIVIDHQAPSSTSQMLYKGIADKQSKIIFNGKVQVHKDAQKIQSRQTNHNLLLSDAAEVATKPDLEIYADDVQCTHGATVGQMDTDALFFLRARGIPLAAARQILTQAFAAEVIASIACPAVKQKMADLLAEAFAYDA